jgi:hypothetical protein
MNDQPSESARERGVRSAKRISSTTARLAGICAIATALGALALMLVPVRIGVVLGAGGAALACVFTIASRRASKAAAAIASGPWSRVHAVGWCRPPDGCNYGIFTRAPRPGDVPSVVMRLPIRREMTKSTGWLCGAAKPGILGSVALINDDGELLGTGRVIREGTALKRWRRRETQPLRFLMKPPKNWLPPGGS